MKQILTALSLVILPSQNLFADTRGYGEGYGMGPWMMWKYGMGWFWPIIMIIFWIAVIFGIVMLIRWMIVSTGRGREAAPVESALDILKKRYALGEIDKAEFEEKKKDLEK